MAKDVEPIKFRKVNLKGKKEAADVPNMTRKKNVLQINEEPSSKQFD